MQEQQLSRLPYAPSRLSNRPLLVSENNNSVSSKGLTILCSADPVDVCIPIPRIIVCCDKSDLLVFPIDPMCISNVSRTTRVRNGTQVWKSGAGRSGWCDANVSTGICSARQFGTAVRYQMQPRHGFGIGPCYCNLCWLPKHRSDIDTEGRFGCSFSRRHYMDISLSDMPVL